MTSRGRVVASLLLMLASACAAPAPPGAPTPEAAVHPGPDDQLPDGASEGAAWRPARGRLAEGVAVGSRFPADDQLFFGVTEPFGRRPMPPGGPGIETVGLEGDDDEATLLVTLPVFGDASVWGEQVLIQLRLDPLGWQITDAWRRVLCTDAARGSGCG